VRKELPDGNITTYTVHAGQYKTRPNSVITATGERFEYASPEETPALMTDLIDWYNGAVDEGKLSALELASLFHYRYIRIHPFEDGNGRIARLLVNFILLRAGYPMIIVRSDDKDKYLSALNRCDVTVGLNPSDGAHAELEQIQPFVNYISGCLERALTIRIRAAKGESIEEKGDWRKKLLTNHTNKINQPECNKEYIEDILNNSFRPILEKIDTDLSPFYSIFSKVKWYPNKTGYEKNDTEKNKDEKEEYFSIITFEDSPNRSLSIGLIVEFIQFKYIISIQICFIYTITK
jgi:Fic family protein